MSGLDNIPRTLRIDLPQGKSAFLWGARQTGKTTLLRRQFPKAIRYDLLETDTYLRLSKEPFRLREELAIVEPNRLEEPIVIDEIQKIPPLLDEVHGLIENRKLKFILSGSSARKLKRSHANLLGGRAWRYELYPLTTHELGKEFDLLRALNRGLIPNHYRSGHSAKEIKSYIQNYLKEEIQSEGLVRRLPAFARFLDAIPFENGELVNYANIARECGVDAKTVAEYHQILIDTLIGSFLEPFRKQKKRQIISATPKFYLFDVGIAGGLAQRVIQTNKGAEFGKAFEHLIYMELCAYRSYSEKDFRMSFWRTKDGSEVDFVLDDGAWAIEVKGSANISAADTKGLQNFMQEHKTRKGILVCQEARPRKLPNQIEIWPWQDFLKKLWSDDLI